MAERQVHGFRTEKRIIAETDHYSQPHKDDASYTGKNDGWDDNKNQPLSVKSMKVNANGTENEFCFSDFRRMAAIKTNITFHIEQYYSDGRTEEIVVDMPNIIWKTLLGNVDDTLPLLDKIKDFDSSLHKRGKKHNKVYADYCKKVRDLYGYDNAILKIRPKIGNKKKDRGARWQCAISACEFKKLVKKYDLEYRI